MSKITREQAEAALAAVKAQWAKELTPTDWSGHAHDESLTGDALRAHLAEEHGYSEETLARWAAKGATQADKHAEAHAPEAMFPDGPALIEDYDGEGWAIVWEDGPDDWALRVNEGGPAESDYVLAAEVAAEFGVAYDSGKVKGPGPAPGWPKAVFGEPIYTFVLGLYPA